jgi:hypothetical protein
MLQATIRQETRDVTMTRTKITEKNKSRKEKVLRHLPIVKHPLHVDVINFPLQEHTDKAIGAKFLELMAD